MSGEQFLAIFILWVALTPFVGMLVQLNEAERWRQNNFAVGFLVEIFVIATIILTVVICWALNTVRLMIF